MTDLLSQNIDQLFDEPWFTGTSGVPAQVPDLWQVSIDGHPYIIEPSKYSRQTVPLQRQSTDESVEPGEQTLNVAGAWRRSQDNWFLGAGQEFLDNRFAFVSVYVHSGEDPSVRTRFWRSKGVNPWTEGGLSLLDEYHAIKATPTGLTALTLYGTKTKTGTTGKLSTSNSTTATPTHQGNTKVQPERKIGHIAFPAYYFPLSLGTPSTAFSTGTPGYVGGSVWAVNTLGNGQIPSGRWTFSYKVKVLTAGRTVTGTFTAKAWRMRGGVGTLIGTVTVFAVVANTVVTLTVSGTFGTVTFGPTDRLGLSVVAQVNTTTPTTIVLIELGGTNFSVVTPGYRILTTGTIRCCTVGTDLYFYDGAAVYVTTNPQAFAPTWTAITAPGGGAWPTVYDLATDGAHLYLALGTHGIAKVTPGSTTATTMRPTAPQPTVTPHGATGSTHYTYLLVGRDANGFATLVSASRTITNGNATLGATNNNVISWTAVPGIVTWDVLKGTSATAIATGLTGFSYTDIGAGTAAYTAPTSTTQNFQATFVNYGNGFLLAGAGPTLCSIAANGTTTLVITHFNPSFAWAAGCGSPVAIYVAGYAGNVAEIYGIQISTTTFGLAAPYIAAQVGIGEIVNDMTYYQGLVILATSLGVRAAQDTSSNGFLTIGAVITDLGPSRSCAAYGAFVWFGLTAFDQNDGVWQQVGTSSGTGRLYLSEFSNPLLPAYATDVMAATGVDGPTTSVAICGGVPYFTVTGSGIWGPDGNKVALGFLQPGWTRYGTIENKILVAGAVRHDPLLYGQSVQLEIVPFGGQSFSMSPSSTVGSTGPTEQVSAGNAVGEAFMVIPILRRGTDPTQGPTLRRWTCRAMVIAVRQDQIVVPIMWADEVRSPVGDGTDLQMTLKQEWLFLKALETSGRAFTYQEGALAYTCYIDQIELDGEKWNDALEMMTGLLSVKLMTVA